jgi:signal transduction histidine kinase
VNLRDIFLDFSAHLMANSVPYLNCKRSSRITEGLSVSRSLRNLASHRSLPPADAVLQEVLDPTESVSSKHESYLSEASPCVVYECNDCLEVTFVSENILQLLGLDPREVLGSTLLSDQRIPGEDLIRLSSKLGEIKQLNSMISLTHRFLDKRGLPAWVAHNLWKSTSLDNTSIIRGCIVPIDCDVRVASTEQNVISRFVHKIGNHFQLLNLVTNSLKRILPESRETAILQETIERAIELTRSFSDYNQGLTCCSQVELMDILETAGMTRRSWFETKGVAFESQIQPAMSGATIEGDAYLLDLAIGHVLQNALEATETGGLVALYASAEWAKDTDAVARIRITDSGCGIGPTALANAIVPFFTSKKNHDGLGLSMASRFIEIHRGILNVSSVEGKGTEVEILLPIESTEHSSRSQI